MSEITVDIENLNDWSGNTFALDSARHGVSSRVTNCPRCNHPKDVMTGWHGVVIGDDFYYLCTPCYEEVIAATKLEGEAK